jgi:hypothetical protein
MNDRKYRVGLIVGMAGPSDRQWAWVQHQSAFIAKTLGLIEVVEGPAVVLCTPGFNFNQKEQYGLPSRIWNSRMPAGVSITPMPGRQDGRQAVHMIEEQIRLLELDEIWCLPAFNQGQLSRSRVCQVYYRGQHHHHEARKYKMIPSWVDVHTPSKEPKRKKPGEKAWKNKWN